MNGNFFGDCAAELVDALKEAVVIEPGSDDSIKRLCQGRMYRQLVLSLDQVAACGDEPRDCSDVWLRFSHCALSSSETMSKPKPTLSSSKTMSKLNMIAA